MKFVRRTDWIVIGVLVILCLLGLAVYQFFLKEKPTRAEIYYHSQLIKVAELSEGKDERFSVPGHEQVVFHLYPDGSICFEHSDCKDQICVHSGRLNRAGQVAACLPNGLILKLVSDKEDDLDIMPIS